MLGSTGLLSSSLVSMSDTKEIVEIVVQLIIGIATLYGLYKNIEQGKKVTSKDAKSISGFVASLLKLINILKIKKKK